MPRYKLGPVVGLIDVPYPPAPVDPDPDPETPPTASKVDQDIRFDGVDEGVALFTLPAFDPDAVEPVVAVHLCFVRPPVPEGADVAYFLASDSTVVRVSRTIAPEPGSDNRVGVTLPSLAPGTWDGRTVLEYAG